MTDKPIHQFMNELKAEGFEFEFGAERFADGVLVQSPGYIEEADFIKQEQRRKRAEGNRRWN
jgi:hypothetical protein